MTNQRQNPFSYIFKTSPVYIAVFLMRFSFAFTVVSLQWIAPIPIELGVISSAYPFMEMLTGLLFGLLADRIGRKRIVVFGLFFSSLITLSFTFTDSFYLLVMIHGLQGICAAAIVTSTLASLTDLARKDSRGREMGLYDFCTIGGYGLGFVFALVLIGGQASRAHIPFYFGAAIALIGGIYALVMLKETMLFSSEKVTLTERIRSTILNRKTVALAGSWFVLTILIGVGLTYTRLLFSALPTSLSDVIGLGFTSTPSISEGVLVALLLAGVVLLAFSQTTLGSLSDRFGRRKLVSIGQFSIFGLLVTLIFLFSFHLTLLIALPLLSVFGIGLLAFTPSGLAELADLAPTTGRGSIMGLYSLTVGAGTVVAPLAGGELISSLGTSLGFSTIFLFCAMIMIVVLAVEISDR